MFQKTLGFNIALIGSAQQGNPRGIVPPIFAAATGGTTSDIVVGNKTYRVHTFTTSGTFTVSNGGDFEYLIVGAGGAGAGSTGNGGGGNGGQMITGSANKEAQSYNVVVGGTGTGATSSLFGVSATGGANGSGVSDGVGASGGIDGLPTTIRGTQEYFAGGGGRGGGGGVKGLGGGGAGGRPGQPGTPNTGGGGGGGLGLAGAYRAGGAGGSGIIIVRYQIA
jgi:hypothetical protein